MVSASRLVTLSPHALKNSSDVEKEAKIAKKQNIIHRRRNISYPQTEEAQRKGLSIIDPVEDQTFRHIQG